VPRTLGVATANKRFPRGQGATIGLLLMGLCAGCGGSGELKAYPVQGIVVYKDGAPVKGGTINFEAVKERTNDGQPKPIYATGVIGSDGTFELITNRKQQGAVAGTHRVAVCEEPETGSNFDALQQRPKKPKVPPKYASFDTSGLETTIEPTSNAITIKIDRP
jgi:hypothetical protein